VNDLKWIRIILIIIAVPIIVIVLKELKTVFIPLIFAGFLSFLFSPMLKALSKRKVPVFVSIILVFFILLLFIALLSGVIYASYTSFVDQLPKYQEKFTQMLEGGYVWFEDTARYMNLAFEKLPLFSGAEIMPETHFSITKLLSGTMNFFGELGTYIFLILIYLLFLVAGSAKFENRIRNSLSESRSAQALATMLNIESQVQKYFINKSIISLGTALTGMLWLGLLQVDFVIISGTLLFVLNFIPNIGSIVASLFPILICLVDYGFGWRVILVAVSMLLTQITFANIIEPKFMGERMNLSPIVILISLIFWGWVWGIVGMMLAVPITSTLNIILKQIDKTNIISMVISDE